MSWQLRRAQWNESVSPREDARAGSCLHPHPSRGLGAPQHNARSIMRTRSCRSADTLLLTPQVFGCRPHNVRYVEVHAQRAKTLAVKNGAAPQCRSPAHPLRDVRSRATVARCLPQRWHPLPPKGGSRSSRCAPCAARSEARAHCALARSRATEERLTEAVPFKVEPGKLVLLQLDVTEAAVKVIANGKQIIEVKRPEGALGRVGLRAWRSQMECRKFRVRSGSTSYLTFLS
jgi:hypothetical protein